MKQNKVLRIHSYYSEAASNISRRHGDVTFYFSGVYLHGEIEEICHYDICYPANPQDFPDNVRMVTQTFANTGEQTYDYLFLNGVYPCIVDGQYECTAFLWYDDRYAYEPHWQRGLIVLNTDKKAMEDARKKYNERRLCL